MDETINRELDEALEPHFDEQFATIYNNLLKSQPKMHELSLEEARQAYDMAQKAQGKRSKIAKSEDFSFKTRDGHTLTARTFVPLGEKPKNGWPVFVWYHGGGFALGNINTDNTLCTHWSARSKSMVITLDYRHAPEAKFPTAVNDAWDGFQWVHENAEQLEIDPTNVAVGGCSAGGNLTSNVTHTLRQHYKDKYPPIKLQILLVPSVDNSDGKEKYGTMQSLINTVGLEIKDMVWFGPKYFSTPELRNELQASPINHPESSFSELPPAFVMVAEMDILSGEAIAYHEKLQKNGSPSELKIYKGCPHTFIGFYGFMDKAKEAVADMSDRLSVTFYGEKAKL